MNVTRPELLVLEDFLTPDELTVVRRFVADHAVEFQPAKVNLPGGAVGEMDATVRSAAVMTEIDDVFALLEPKLRALLPHARRETGLGYFALGRIERQLTAHGDGDFFSQHHDCGDGTTESASRRLTYVYYFSDEPGSFTGGQLRVYDHYEGDDGFVHAADTFQDIEPSHNSIVLFPSGVFHEVRPVHAVARNTSGAFRYTINGWFHDRDHVPAEPRLDPETLSALAARYTPTFTATGFEKIATPEAVHRGLLDVYDQRYASARPERADQNFLATGDPDFVDIDDVKATFHEELRALHEAWAGVALVPTAAYGLRVYRRGQTLRMHTDRPATHVISSIVHLAHDSDEPWPLQIVDHLGVHHEVVLEVGEMLLYESAHCLHGRPTPLKGESYCSLFLHYQPVDWNVTARTLVEAARAAGDIELLREGPATARRAAREPSG